MQPEIDPQKRIHSRLPPHGHNAVRLVPHLVPILDFEVRYETLNHFYPLILTACQHSSSKFTKRKLHIVKP